MISFDAMLENLTEILGEGKAKLHQAQPSKPSLWATTTSKE